MRDIAKYPARSMMYKLATAGWIFAVIGCQSIPAPNDSDSSTDDSGTVQEQDTAVTAADVPPPPDTRCFIVYVHGLTGINLDPDIATDAQRRAYWQPTPGSTTFDFVYASSRHGECLTLVTGYDSTAAFFEDVAAGSVARQIVRFVQDNNIPDNRLILIGHSMGGLVIREILDYTLAHSDYELVAQKTNYAITVATPHTGSPAADSLYGLADTSCANQVGGLLEFTHLLPSSMAMLSLTRSFMEEESAPGGLMQDRLRTRTIYTVSTTGWNLGVPGDVEDEALYSAWDCLGYGDCSTCTLRPGDGVVTEYSGEAVFERTGTHNGYAWTTGAWIEGPWTAWLTTNLNHHHAAYSDVQVNITDYVRQTTSTGGSLGDYIANYGLALE